MTNSTELPLSPLNSASLKKVSITPDLFIQWFTKGNHLRPIDCIEGLPEGAKFVTAFSELTCAGGAEVIAIVFWHEDWEPVDISGPIPDLKVEFRNSDERVAIFEDFIKGLDKP